MKVEIKGGEIIEKPKFPSLKRSVTGNVFLCLSEANSVCLIANGGGFKVGDLCHPSPDRLVLIEESITLSNE